MAAQKIFLIIEKRTEISAMDNSGVLGKQVFVNPSDFKGKIEFHNVWFRYPTRKNDWVLRGLNLEISPNETVALVGESGCGKSTLVSLLMRFYDVDFGSITIDGVDIKDYNLRQLRQTMSLVMQEPTLFNYSIQENILYGDSNATNSQIRDAAMIANAMEFIESHEMVNMVEDTAQGLVKELEKTQVDGVSFLGKALYADKLHELRKIALAEEKRGVFAAVEGDIDNRS